MAPFEGNLMRRKLLDLEIPFENIESATDNFADENLIAQDSVSKDYKGTLSQSGQLINIVARRFVDVRPSIERVNGIISLIYLKHKDILSIVGCCQNNNDFIVVYEHAANGNLDKYLSDPTLTWTRRLHICVGLARALSYIHDYVEHDRVLHCNINSSKILLDADWEPKLCGFRYSTVLAENQRVFHSSKYRGSLQYMDPAYENTRCLTTKSDVFAFGVVLFEILFGRKASIPNTDNWYFARLARLQYEKERLDEMIDPDLRAQMDLKSFKIFSETAYHCLLEQGDQRPNMDQIVKRLEVALELQKKHENPEQSTLAVEGTSSNPLKGKDLEHLKIRLRDIELATKNFDKEYRIGSGGYGTVYKAELDHFDVTNSSTIEGNNKCELPRIRSTVAIKRISSREDGQGEQGFFAEIEILSKCKHPNIVSLVGFCDEGPQMILVYEHASKGSLDGYLGNVNNMTNLTWAQRIRICLDIAHGLKYLHTITEDKPMIIHRDIKSDNILLDEDWVAKLADFGLSRLHHHYQQGNTLNTKTLAGTELYCDPEYLNTGRLKKESDIYSFGVVLFEMVCGRLAYDKIYNSGLPSVAQQSFRDGTLKEMVDPKIKEVDENIFMLNRGLNPESLDTFLEIAIQCLSETQAKRPTMEVIIEKLEKALYLQEKRKDNREISLEDIKSATQNFSDDNCIEKRKLWKLYEGEYPPANGRVLVKRWDIHESSQHEHQFLREVEILLKVQHENLIGLVGYCNQMEEKIIVYEHAINGSLDKHLKDASLTWTKRLKICMDVAYGLDFLHNYVIALKMVIHRDIRSASILLDGDWKARISNLELAAVGSIHDQMENVKDNSFDTFAYLDLEYHSSPVITTESDIYSFGVVLFEVLCGRFAWQLGCCEKCLFLAIFAKRRYEEGNLDELVFEGIKEQIVPQSLVTFQKIAYQCLHSERDQRPKAWEVYVQLEKALEFQEDYEVWEPKLPIDYKEIIQMSKTPEIYSTEKKKDLYDLLTKGILLQEGKLWFSLGSNGERNEIISARKFSYRNRRSHKWRSVPKSRFQKVAKMLDISNLKILIQIKTQFLSPDVFYGVRLVFKFCDPIKISSKPMYVNLKYKMGTETLYAYFATWRDDEWMMVELCRFLNHKEDVDFDVLLESFSRYYCGNGAIYVEGIEFRAIDNVEHEETEKLEEAQQVLKSNSNMDKPFDEQFSVSEVQEKKQLMLSAKEVLYGSSDAKFFRLKPSEESRFGEVVEILPKQVFRIKCKIDSQRFSPNTNYTCYLVFKLSDKSNGLHCPVKVRDLLHRNNKETEILYFRSPTPLNRHDIYRVPKQREDGWMEVHVWKVNSTYGLKDDFLRVNLKFISYEGTMAGLVICGLEFRPM